MVTWRRRILVFVGFFSPFFSKVDPAYPCLWLTSSTAPLQSPLALSFKGRAFVLRSVPGLTKSTFQTSCPLLHYRGGTLLFHLRFPETLPPHTAVFHIVDCLLPSPPFPSPSSPCFVCCLGFPSFWTGHFHFSLFKVFRFPILLQSFSLLSQQHGRPLLLGFPEPFREQPGRAPISPRRLPL